MKKKLKGFLQRILQEIMKKKYMVNKTIIPSTRRPRVLYWRLSDFDKIAQAW